MDRIVIHVDVNNAFLSWTAVNMLKNGSKVDIRKRYAVIGGDESQRRGIVLAKSIPCKNKGVTTGESLYMARRKCPYLDVYPPEFYIYKKYSDMMYEYLLTYTDIIERYSIDECFMEYTNSYKLFGDPVKIAYKIKDDIKNKFGFTVNVGVGNNKLLAKMASDFSKPDKVHTLFYNEIESKMWPLDVKDLFMIGKSTSKKLYELNIKTIYELAHTDREFLVRHFKSFGNLIHDYANGIDNSLVETDRGNPKSISNSVVLPYDYHDKDEILKVMKELSMEVGKTLRKKNMYAMNVFIWIKYKDFTKISKQATLENQINSDIDIYNHAADIFNKLWDNEKKIRALCVGVSNLTDKYREQLNIFNVSDNTNIKKDMDLQKTIDKIRKKYGNDSITYADILEKND